MPDALHFTDDPEACRLLATDPFALLVGFAIDQQVTVPKAFAGPYVLKQRAGTLEPKQLASIDLRPLFAEKPAIHRFPGAMADRVRDLAAVVSEDYGGRRVAHLDRGERQRGPEEADRRAAGLRRDEDQVARSGARQAVRRRRSQGACAESPDAR